MDADIYYVLDKSGSMEPRKSQVVAGFNEFLASQTSSRLSLYMFSTHLETVFEHQSVDQVMPLSLERYDPEGGTALWDALGTLLEEKIQWKTEASTIILVLLTDGEDNSSVRHTRSSIRQWIEDHPSCLELVFVGSNQEDLFSVSRDSSLEYEDHFLEDAMRITTHAIRRFQTDETASIQFTSLERQQTMKMKWT